MCRAVVLWLAVAGGVFGPGEALAQEKKPLVVGASVSLEGTYARTGEYQLQGYQMWVEDVNRRGGLLGLKVELRYYNDKSDPNEAAKLYERLITVDQVDLLLGPYSSPVTKAAAPVVEKHKFPMVSAGAAATEIWTKGYRFLFQVYTPEDFYMDGVIDLAVKAGYKTAAVINEDTAFAKGTALGAMEKAKARGLQIVLHEQYGKGVKDLSSLVLKIKARNPDVILGGSYLPDSTLFMRQAKELDLHAKIFAFSVGPGLPDFYQNLGKDGEYVFGPSQWEPTLRIPGAREFAKRYQAKHGVEAGYHAAGGYGAGQILEAAVRKAGALDREKIRQALSALETTTIFGDYQVDARGLQVKKASYMTQWLKGAREVVWPDAAATAKPVIPTPAWKGRK